MTENPNKGLITFRRKMSINRLCYGDYYCPAEEGCNQSITQESVNQFASDLINEFLKNHATGHVDDHACLYRNHVAGEVFLSVDENRICRVLSGFDTISNSILLLNALHILLGGLDTLTIRGWGEQYRDSLNSLMSSSLNRELLKLFADWVNTKVAIKETVTITPEGKEMVLEAIQSGTTDCL